MNFGQTLAIRASHLTLRATEETYRQSLNGDDVNAIVTGPPHKSATGAEIARRITVGRRVGSRNTAEIAIRLPASRIVGDEKHLH